MVREGVAAPMLGPRLRVVGDDAILAASELEVRAPPHNGGLPSLTATDVGVRGPTACGGGCGDPVVPAVTAGVAQRGERWGGGVMRLIGVLA